MRRNKEKKRKQRNKETKKKIQTWISVSIDKCTQVILVASFKERFQVEIATFRRPANPNFANKHFHLNQKRIRIWFR
jgi:hypothetical protein